MVEVAVTSHRLDRGRKADLYAGANVPTYWLVDVPGRAIEVRTRPGADGYRSCEIYGEGSIVASPLDGLNDLDVGVLLADIPA